MCVCVCFLPISSGRQVRWTYQPGSHRRKVTQDFSSTFLLRCVPLFFSREGFSRSFPSSTVKSNLCANVLINRSPLVGHFYFHFHFFSEEKFELPGFELTSQRVRRLRGCQLSYRGDSKRCCRKAIVSSTYTSYIGVILSIKGKILFYGVVVHTS